VKYSSRVKLNRPKIHSPFITFFDMLFLQRDKAINMYSLTCSICILIVIFINRIHDALLCIIQILIVVHRTRTNTRSSEGNKIFTALTKGAKNCEGCKQRRYHLEILLHTKMEHVILLFISRNYILIPKVYYAFLCAICFELQVKDRFKFARSCKGNFNTV
jgi:hypothetical protein